MRTYDSASRYGCAIASVTVAILVRRLLDVPLGDDAPFATLYFAVTLSAWYGGFAPAMTAAILGAAAAAYFFLDPRGSLAVDARTNQAELMLYLLISGGIALF